MLIFKHGFLIELRIFFMTLRKKKWLDKERYTYYLWSWPHRCNRKNLIAQIQVEFKQYEPKLQEVSAIIVHLVHCGTYGSYDLQNNIYIYCHRQPRDIAETIVHEIVHLQTEREVIEKHLSHDEKEKLVDERVEAILRK